MAGPACELCGTTDSVAEGPCAGCEAGHDVCDRHLPGYYLRPFPQGWMWPCCPDAFELNEALRGRG